MTSRELIEQRRREVRDAKALTPDRAADILLEVTSTLGVINDEIRIADQEYAIVLSRFLAAETKANRARINAEITPEYERKRKARDTKEEAEELIRSIKYYLRAEEYHP